MHPFNAKNEIVVVAALRTARFSNLKRGINHDHLGLMSRLEVQYDKSFGEFRYFI